MTREYSTIEYVFNDGGQTTVGAETITGDCVTRAIAIITDTPYREVYDNLYRVSLEYATNNDDRAARAMRRAMKVGGPHWKWHPNPATGVPWEITDNYLVDLGWFHHPIFPGNDGKYWLNLGDIAGIEGRYILRLNGHMTAVIDGKVQDMFNPEEYGPIPVVGYWRQWDAPIDKWIGPRSWAAYTGEEISLYPHKIG